jgi:hypothetical protein
MWGVGKAHEEVEFFESSLGNLNSVSGDRKSSLAKRRGGGGDTSSVPEA